MCTHQVGVLCGMLEAGARHYTGALETALGGAVAAGAWRDGMGFMACARPLKVLPISQYIDAYAHPQLRALATPAAAASRSGVGGCAAAAACASSRRCGCWCRCELMRRVLGVAKRRSLQGIAHEATRLRAEGIVLDVGERCAAAGAGRPEAALADVGALLAFVRSVL